MGDYVHDLERSHDELRAALILAGRQLRKLSFGRADDRTSIKLRQVLEEARRLRKARKQQGAVLRMPLQ